MPPLKHPAMSEAASPRATLRATLRAHPSADPAYNHPQSPSPIVLSEAWKQLHLATLSASFATPPRDASTYQPTHREEQDADSSDDGFLSDHSEEIHPETGFDPFLAATRRARQNSTTFLLTQHPLASSDAPSAHPSASPPSPPASHHNIPSEAALLNEQAQLKQQEAYRWSRIAKYWSKVVDRVMLQPNQPQQRTIDLSDENITDILPTIADLSRFVALPPPRYDRDDDFENRSSPEPQNLLQSKTGGLIRHESYLAPFSAHIHNDSASAKSPAAASPSLSRSQSAFQPSFRRAHSFARTNSAKSTSSSRSAASYHDHRDRQATLSIFLGSNALTRLPSALFQLQNLRVLSLRSNKLKYLPPAIGDLHNLSELHVPNNELQYLPAEILRLKLSVFTWFPNPFLVKPPKSGVLTIRPLLCHRAKRIRQQHSFCNLAELDQLEESDELQEHDDASSTTPVRNDTDIRVGPPNSAPVSQQPPPLIRAPAASSSRQQRYFDRTRSELQVEGFLARGIDQLQVGSFASNNEQDADTDQDTNSTDAADPTSDPDHTASRMTPLATSDSADVANASDAVDDAERERQRILEAAFEDEDGAHAFDITPSTETGALIRGKVAGRSRVLGSKQLSGLPSLQELCIRKLLSPYDVSEAESHGIASPFLSPMVQTFGGPQRRRGSSSSRNNSRIGTPLFQAQQHHRVTSFGSNARRTRIFSSNGGPEDSRFGKRVPTLLEAYENGTLQSLVGELGHGLIPLLEAARRSATQDWGTRARVCSSSSVAAKRSGFSRTQSVVGAFPLASREGGAQASLGSAKQPQAEEEAYDVFGDVDVPGSLDRGDDACSNPWFSRCPNPKHCEEKVRESWLGHGVKRNGDIALHRGKRGLGSTCSVSSLGTTLGGGKADAGATEMERVLSTAASSDSGFAPASPLSSSASSLVGTVAGSASASTSSMPLRAESQASGNIPFVGPQVRFAASTQRSLSSSGLGRTWSSSRLSFGGDRGMARPASTQFVRGFSTSSALSASGLHRSTSFGADNGPYAERDWPLSEQEHRQAPVFSTPGETRIEWISHIGGIRVAKFGEAQVDLDADSMNAPATSSSAQGVNAGEASQPSMLGAMGGFENKDLLPILWRGCSRGCLDFLV